MSDKKTDRIETKSSRTAGFTCMSRAASYKDRRECYSGPDYIAYMFIDCIWVIGRHKGKSYGRRLIEKYINDSDS